jgi:hypothetical protein
MTEHLTDDQLHAMVDSWEERAPASGDAQTHLDGCPTCADRLADLHSLVGAARALPRELDLRVDAWPAIRSSIEGGQRRRAADDAPARSRTWRRWAGGLVAASALVAATAVTTARVVRDRSMTPVAGSASSAGVGVVPASLAAVDGSFAPTLRDLAAALDASRGKLAPETVARVERSLSVIDQAIAEVRDALARDPANTVLVELLAGSYRQKVELLRRASELAPIS